MRCFSCNKKRSVETCGVCREITKADLARHVKGLSYVLIDEHNKSKGVPPKNIDEVKILEYLDAGLSHGQIAKKMKVSRGTIRNRLKALGKL